MAARIIATEVRWRRAGSEQEWRVKRFPPTSSAIEIDELGRGTSYEGQARNLGIRGTASAWVPVDFVVADASNTPLQPTNLTASSVSDGVALAWGVSDLQKPDVEYVVETALASTGPWTEKVRVRSLQWTDPVLDDIETWYRVRAISFAGVPSAYSDVVSEKGYRDYTNLVRKGRFEDGKVGSWGSGATIYANPIGPWNNQLRVEETSYEERGWFDVREGEEYTLSALMNPNNLTSGEATLRLHVQEGSGNNTFPVAATITKTDGIKVISGHIVIPANAVRARAAVFLTSPETDFVGVMDVRCVKGDALRIAGSGARLGDSRNQQMVTVGNFGSAWNGLELSYTSTSTTATISASAATLDTGSASIAYNASSVGTTGTAGQTKTYYLFYDDPKYQGGSIPLGGTTNYRNTIRGNGRLFLGKIDVVFPSSGTGGGIVPPDDNCVCVDAWVIRRNGEVAEPVRAGSVCVGDELRVIDPATGRERWGRVSMSRAAPAECVRVVTEAGTALTCSTTAPLGTGDGQVLAPESVGRMLAERRHGQFGHSRGTSVEPAGLLEVQHITCENDFFLAGDDPDALLAHHNIKYNEP